MIRTLLLCVGLAGPTAADTVVATRTIPAQSLIMDGDVTVSSRDIPGVVSDPAQVIGMEARVALFAGRPIRPADVGFPAVVERNQIIPLYFQRGGLMISTEGRALGRAGPGDLVRVMNISSRSTVTARIGADGAGYVAP
ncbi:flagellar basal body P-ring formation chaperone FlgA [Cognatiyoonia sp. IB215446]|uniref:flagellar basal body P-ring formation chaperone FlgA n=1 Tax=Cognatiyoonia sp. IB215446 TaxID=3097355 RepID=UPI002A0E3FC2|nr:flagellar basal body P-ring formation chaperone FlgA [Cognatiyoonia sp. IB215446]MDX8346416.1 flagellar basal body P-ring formation chaperone FlgA [Cognatiyoonia sp. IB215446]